MNIEVFKLERMQSTWENLVDYNLAESGVHALSLEEFIPADELRDILGLRLGYSQTNGTPELRERIASAYPGLDPEQVQVTAGSTEANFLLIWGLIDPGDEVLFELPNYLQMWGLLRGFGAKVKTFRLREDRNWAPDLDELKKKLSRKTKLIILTNPNNPTGAVLTRNEMNTIIDLAQASGAWILADEVYQNAERIGPKTASFWGLYDKVISVNGLSKAYGLPGLRIGWIIGPPDKIRKIWPYHDYTTISPSGLSDRLARTALSPAVRGRILKRTHGILTRNYAILESWLAKQAGLFSFVPPKAGAIAFVRYNLPLNSTEFALKVIREKSVFVAPGDLFEMDHFLRIGFGLEEQALQAALARLEDILAKIGKSPQPD